MPEATCRMDILAPLSGVLVDLAAVPDPVFAQKLAGDGISIDPTSSEVLAPVSGVVTQMHAACHALTVSSQGVDVLVHIGIDTVLLKGEGFQAKVKKGDKVQAGQPLVSFDADLVACRARSLLTQVVVASGERVRSMEAGSGVVRAGRDVILSLEFTPVAGAPQAGAAAGEPPAGGPQACAGPGGGPQTDAGPGGGVQAGAAACEPVFSESIALPNAAGLHARPAATLAVEAKRYGADIRLVHETEEANAKSVVAVLGLSLKQGDAVKVKAVGADAAVAVAALSALLAAGCGETMGGAPAAAAPAGQAQADAQPLGGGQALADGQVLPDAQAQADAHLFAGVAASPGLAVGRVAQYRQKSIVVREEGEGQALELDRLEAALYDARRQVDDLRRQASGTPRAGIMDAHHELLDDPELIGLARAGLEGGRSAAFAWREAYTAYADKLMALDSALLRERAGDIRDVGRRVLALLAGAPKAPQITGDQTILVADELSPSDTAALDRTKVLGFCTTTGGATGHVAILARSLGIPAVCGMDERALDLEDGLLVVLDGDKGLLRLSPDEAELALAGQRMADMALRQEREQAAVGQLAVTTDGQRVEVAANVRNAQEARDAAAGGAEGVGLVRSEFLFDQRDSAPDEEEQAQEYAGVAQAMGPGRRVVIRTLDVGGDKPLSYLPMPREANPFLGVRGLRVSLERPDMFRIQLRAILRAAPLCDLHIMFPMVATLEELRQARRYLAQEQDALGVEAKVGVMIEVPSAAVMADLFAPEVDFFSIGSNDLTQYTLAMDRGHKKLARQADALHPAVLRLIDTAARAAHDSGKWVGVCGGMASDVLAVPALVGLGVDELSVSVPAVAAVKAAVSALSAADCRLAAAELLRLGTAAEVRAHLGRLAG